TLQLRDDRPERGIDRSGAAVADAAVIAGESHVFGSEMVPEVDVQRVTYGADDRHLVHHSRVARQHLGDSDTRHARAHRAMGSPHLGGGLGLGMGCLVWGRTAVEPDQDDGKVVAIPRLPAAGPRQVNEAQAGETHDAGTEQAATREPPVYIHSMAAELEHRPAPRNRSFPD